MIWESQLTEKNYWTNTFSLALQKKMLDKQNSSTFPRDIPGVTIQNMRREIDFKLIFCWYGFIVVNIVSEYVEIQAYSRCTSEEKLAITSKLEKKKLKTVTSQDGTNNFLKHKSETVEEILQHHQDLIKQIQANHELEKIFFLWDSTNNWQWRTKCLKWENWCFQRHA